MDPNESLKELLRAAREIIAQFDAIPDMHENPGYWRDEQARADSFESIAEIGQVLAELVLALDGWIASGGFLPERWAR